MSRVGDVDRIAEPLVRPATADDLPAVANVIDGAALAVEHDRLRRAVERGDVLVAVAGGEPDERILGALALEGAEIVAVAVRRERRSQGIGTALVEAAAEGRERLVAAFDPGVRPFWESLGFDVARIEGTDRFRGVR